MGIVTDWRKFTTKISDRIDYEEKQILRSVEWI